jgi:hypothetical protein
VSVAADSELLVELEDGAEGDEDSESGAGGGGASTFSASDDDGFGGVSGLSVVGAGVADKVSVGIGVGDAGVSCDVCSVTVTSTGNAGGDELLSEVVYAFAVFACALELDEVCVTSVCACARSGGGVPAML